MRITTTTRYGVRALFDIAYNGAGQPTQIKDIARRQKISQRYLEQIFNKLLKSGLLKSTRGPRGGYRLAKDASQITVIDIVNAVQEPIVALGCLDDKECGNTCELFDQCVTRLVWKESQEKLIGHFQSISLADLCTQARKLGVRRDIDHRYMYYI